MSMITALDHIAVRTADVASAIGDYQTVLGWTARGTRLQLGNVALSFATKDAERTELGLGFSTADVVETARRLARRGLPSDMAAADRAVLDRAATHDVAIEFVAAAVGNAVLADHDIIGLDHVVVRTGDPERAVALYGGRLGLDLRLDRTNPDRGNRLLFFVCGDLVVEISHDTTKGIVPGPDSIRGLAWRAADVQRAHTRMSTAGVAVSEIRTGNRPGTQVFTVKSHTAGVPTLVIGGRGLERH